MLSRKQMHGISAKPDNATTRSYGTISHADSFGTDLAMRAGATQPVAAYDDYVKSGQQRRFTGVHTHRRFQGCYLRRAVIMRKQGSTWKEIEEVIGVNRATIKEWLDFLPLELQP